jgi:hypothetical protein
VRRLLAILLLSVISTPLVTPAVFAKMAGTNLPPCCRTAGKHKCALKHEHSGFSTLSIGDRCPVSTAIGDLGLNLHVFVLSAGQAVSGAGLAALVPYRYSQTIAPKPFSCAHYKRGPPPLLT